MPHLEANASEKAIIAAILNKTVKFRDVALTFDDFTDMTCQAVWQIMERVDSRGQDCTMVNVLDARKETNHPPETEIIDLACNNQIIVSSIMAPQYVTTCRPWHIHRIRRSTVPHIMRCLPSVQMSTGLTNLGGGSISGLTFSPYLLAKRKAPGGPARWAFSKRHNCQRRSHISERIESFTGCHIVGY